MAAFNILCSISHLQGTSMHSTEFDLYIILLKKTLPSLNAFMSNVRAWVTTFMPFFSSFLIKPHKFLRFSSLK